jgi:methionine synthase / methylenetetrahydrofolate reductase(NADPH)
MAGEFSSAAETNTATARVSALDRLFAGVPVLGDGAMGTMLCDRGISIDRCYDELNLSQPEAIASIHDQYLRAGAEIVETNTFGANAYRLERHGLRAKVREINLAGVRIVRECVALIAEEQAAEAYVAGCVGPLGVQLAPLGKIGLDEARAAFAEQIRALAEGGPGVGADLLVIETMTSLAEAQEAIRAARDAAPELRLVVMMTVDEQGNCLDGASPETAALRLTEFGAEVVGCNCSFGPANVLSVIQRMRAVTRLPLAAMSNAGLPRMADGRGVYTISPEDMASFVPRFMQTGAALIGGCCGTTPDHTCAMKWAMRAFLAEAVREGGRGP